MKHNFYSHLIKIETVTVELDNLDLEEQERHHLAQLIDTNLHFGILDAIFDELSIEDKKVFISHLDSKNDAKIWEFLNTRVDKVEEKIIQTAEKMLEELKQDIGEARKAEEGDQ